MSATEIDLPEVIVSYSELDTFRQCPFKHHLAYQMRYVKPNKEDGALAKGTLYHAVMETHYKVIQDWQNENNRVQSADEEADLLVTCAAEVAPLLRDSVTGEQTDVQSLIEWMYNGYVEHYGSDRQWRIMGVEHAVQVPLLDRDGNPSRYTLKAKIDLLVRDGNGNLWVVDHKSGKDLPNSMALEIDDQFGLYAWLMRRLGRKVIGAIHSANRTYRTKAPQALEARMSRTHLARSEKELTNLALDAYEAARAAYPDDPANAPRYSSPDPRQCGWKCDFKEAHLAMRKGANPMQAMADWGFRINRTRH